MKTTTMTNKSSRIRITTNQSIYGKLGQDQTRYKSSRSFYSLSERKVYQDFRLPVPYYKNCRGSSYGWLITVDEEQVQQPDGTYIYPVRLLNPFRSANNEIQLPPLTPVGGVYEIEPGHSYYLFKALLSANPSSLSNPADLLVLGVYGCKRYGFCRPGDSVWTHLPLDEDRLSQFRPTYDLVVCYKGRFHAVIQKGSVLDLDFAHHLPEPELNITVVARPPTNGDLLTRKYLVELGGDLLQVQRYVLVPQEEESDENYSTITFRVFKLNDAAAADDDDDDEKWVEMNHLDGSMLFLGDNHSISLSATDFPGLMPNCIYFTDDYYEYYDVGPHDFGIFNLVDQSFARHYAMHNTFVMPPPIWIQPML